MLKIPLFSELLQLEPSMMSQGKTLWKYLLRGFQGSEGSFQGIFHLERPLRPLSTHLRGPSRGFSFWHHWQCILYVRLPDKINEHDKWCPIFSDILLFLAENHLFTNLDNARMAYFYSSLVFFFFLCIFEME